MTTPQERAIAERAGQNPYPRSMTMAEILERQSKVNVLRPAKGKFRPMSTSTPNTEIDADVMESLTGLDRLRMHVVDPDTFEVCFDYISGAVDEVDAMVTRLAELEHYHRYFEKIAKMHWAANAALDTARREWAKKAEGK